MEGTVQASWPALATLLAGVANLYLARVVWRFRSRPGGRWFAIVAVLMAASCFSYGLALVVFSPRWLRRFLEALHWANGPVMGGVWLAFALSYTGRGHLVRSTTARGVALLLGVVALIPLTAPAHGLFWTGFALEPAFGAATATFVREPGLYVTMGAALAPIAVSFVVLLDTLLSYGRLFRSQTLALGLTPILPTAAVVAYTFRLGPAPNLNLVPMTLLPHAVLDLYALYGATMFEFDPATRRIGERTATDDLASPIVTVDVTGRLITVNEAAAELIETDKRHVVGQHAERYLGDEFEPGTDGQTIEVRLDGKRRQYRVTSTPFSDSNGTILGYNMVLQDVTDVVQRQQRLAVLNRVLRHNLRNELSVVTGNAEVVASRADDPDLASCGEKIVSVSQRLAAFGDRAREFDRILDSATESAGPSAVADVVEDVVINIQETHPDARIDVDVPADLELRVERSVLRIVFENLLRNAIEHNDGERPRVEVRATVETDGRSVHFEIRDNGPGIPDAEVAVLSDGSETALEHGSGLGLWVVHSAVTAMGGDVSFETADSGGTTVSLRLPGIVDKRAP